jgi:hypothetical protein
VLAGDDQKREAAQGEFRASGFRAASAFSLGMKWRGGETNGRNNFRPIKQN